MTLCLTQTSHLTGGYLDLHVINWCPKLVHSEGFGIMKPVLQDSYYITHCINTSVFIQISPVNMIYICIFLSLCYLNTIVSLMGFNKASFILLLRESKCFYFWVGDMVVLKHVCWVQLSCNLIAVVSWHLPAPDGGFKVTRLLENANMPSLLSLTKPFSYPSRLHESGFHNYCCIACFIGHLKVTHSKYDRAAGQLSLFLNGSHMIQITCIQLCVLHANISCSNTRLVTII